MQPAWGWMPALQQVWAQASGCLCSASLSSCFHCSRCSATPAQLLSAQLLQTLARECRSAQQRHSPASASQTAPRRSAARQPPWAELHLQAASARSASPQVPAVVDPVRRLDRQPTGPPLPSALKQCASVCAPAPMRPALQTVLERPHPPAQLPGLSPRCSRCWGAALRPLPTAAELATPAAAPAPPPAPPAAVLE